MPRTSNVRGQAYAARRRIPTPGLAAWIDTDQPTALGVLVAGLPVTVLHVTPEHITVCIDNNHHPSRVCHAVTVDRAVVHAYN